MRGSSPATAGRTRSKSPHAWVACCCMIAGCGAEPTANVAEAAPQRVPAPPEITASELAGPTGGLCRAQESVIFQCAAGGKRVAICTGRSDSGQRYVQYRFGSSERIELECPSSAADGADGMYWARTGYSGGGEIQVRFANQGYEYIVYSRVIRTGFGADGVFHPRFESGVSVVRGRRLVSDIRCQEPPDPWVSEQEVESLLPEGEFFRWWDLANLPNG